jgi:hypothetical protein
MKTIAPTAPLKFEAPANAGACFCEICKNSKGFDLPPTIADSFIKGEVVLFVGAGVSTEAKGLLPHTFYEEISHAIGNSDLNRPFPEVMDEFCAGAEGRAGLIQKLKSRLDYIYGHDEIYHNATRFHRELATFFPIDTIVTSNWDPYFEDECGATPLVEEKDIAFWDVADRKVLKIHGSISNYGSIIATTEDYAKCTKKLESGLLGARLKSLLATRNTIFIGYSLRDDDFLQIYNAVRTTLAEFHRQSFFVAPDVAADDRKRLSDLKLRLVETDGQYFVAQLKQHAQSKLCIASDDIYSRALSQLILTTADHEWLLETFDMHKHPQILFCAWYQDGFIHALKRILRLRTLGTYSDLHRIIRMYESYFNFAKRYRADKKYDDSAYCYGYANAYLYARLSEDRPNIKPPTFYYFDAEIVGRTTYKKALKQLPSLHKSAFKYARKIVSEFPVGAEIVIHDKDQLNLGPYVND